MQRIEQIVRSKKRKQLNRLDLMLSKLKSKRLESAKRKQRSKKLKKL